MSTDRVLNFTIRGVQVTVTMSPHVKTFLVECQFDSDHTNDFPYVSAMIQLFNYIVGDQPNDLKAKYIAERITVQSYFPIFCVINHFGDVDLHTRVIGEMYNHYIPSAEQYKKVDSWCRANNIPSTYTINLPFGDAALHAKFVQGGTLETLSITGGTSADQLRATQYASAMLNLSKWNGTEKEKDTLARLALWRDDLAGYKRIGYVRHEHLTWSYQSNQITEWIQYLREGALTLSNSVKICTRDGNVVSVDPAQEPTLQSLLHLIPQLSVPLIQSVMDQGDRISLTKAIRSAIEIAVYMGRSDKITCANQAGFDLDMDKIHEATHMRTLSN